MAGNFRILLPEKCSALSDCHGRSDSGREFGPKLLKSVRQRMIDAGLCRKTINTSIGRIRRMFRWAVAEELVPANVLTAIAAVTGLQAGRSNAKEGKIVSPTSRAAVDAIRPFVSHPVWAAVELQMLTGMRSGEVLAMCGRDKTPPE